MCPLKRVRIPLFGGGSWEEEVRLGRGLDWTGSEKVKIDVGRSEFRRPPLPAPGGDDCCPMFDSLVVVRLLGSNVRRGCREDTPNARVTVEADWAFGLGSDKIRESGREENEIYLQDYTYSIGMLDRSALTKSMTASLSNLP